jgi:hypothetical protein
MVLYDVVGYIRCYLDVGVGKFESDILHGGGVSEYGFVDNNVMLGYGL